MKALRVMYVLPSARRGVAERLALELLSLHDPALVTPSVCFLEDGPMVGVHEITPGISGGCGCRTCSASMASFEAKVPCAQPSSAANIWPV